MDDTLRNLVLGFFGLLALHGSLERRARRDAENQVRRVVHNTGSITARVEGRGLLGMLTNDVWSVDIYGKGQVTDSLPFYVYPRSGWKGSIRHLRFHFRNLTLSGFTVDRFEADVPFATYDLGQALYRDTLELRSAGTGPGMVVASQANLQSFVSRKYQGTLSDVSISSDGGRLRATGNIVIFGSVSPFDVVGALSLRSERYVDLSDPILRLNGVLLGPVATRTVMRNINPLLDSENDLHIGSFFRMQKIELNADTVTIRGMFTIPSDDQKPGVLQPTEPAPSTGDAGDQLRKNQ